MYIGPIHFGQNLLLTLIVEKNSRKMFSATFVISKKHLKANNHSMGENSPILVTLIPKQQRSFSSNQF
jgi:hypothetical protein